MTRVPVEIVFWMIGGGCVRLIHDTGWPSTAGRRW